MSLFNTMAETTPKEQFLHSLKRCGCNENFIPAFYDRFLGESDEIRAKFRNTDFEKQNVILLRSLELAAGATNGDSESLREIKDRAQTHDRHNLNIEPRFYETWLDCVIATASEFDPQWDEDTKRAWETILRHVIDHMIRYY